MRARQGRQLSCRSFGRFVCKLQNGAQAAFNGSIQDRDAAMMQSACHCILNTQARANPSAIITSP